MDEQDARATAEARPIAFERVFGEQRFGGVLFPAIRQEAEARAVDATEPGAFLMLGATGALLHELPPDPGSGDPLASDAVLRYGAVAYHGYHFWRAGQRVYAVSEAAARSLASAPPHVGEWGFRGPAAAGYVALPHQLFWVPGQEGSAAEPVDGLSWVHAAADAPVRLLLALGVREDRPGFSIVDFEAPLPPPPARHWADIDGRDGVDFANVLPGGELAEIYSLTTPAEALKLLSIVLWAIDRHPEAVGPETAVAGRLPRRLLRAWDAGR